LSLFIRLEPSSHTVRYTFVVCSSSIGFGPATATSGAFRRTRSSRNHYLRFFHVNKRPLYSPHASAAIEIPSLWVLVYILVAVGCRLLPSTAVPSRSSLPSHFPYGQFLIYSGTDGYTQSYRTQPYRFGHVSLFFSAVRTRHKPFFVVMPSSLGHSAFRLTVLSPHGDDRTATDRLQNQPILYRSNGGFRLYVSPFTRRLQLSMQRSSFGIEHATRRECEGLCAGRNVRS
jgi:hypothetical protein